jgi:hypothetical protein
VTDERSCAVCIADLSDRRPDAKTCSARCRRELSRRREREALYDPNLSSALAMTARLAAASDSTVDRDAQTAAEHPEASEVGALTKALEAACARLRRALRSRMSNASSTVRQSDVPLLHVDRRARRDPRYYSAGDNGPT